MGPVFECMFGCLGIPSISGSSTLSGSSRPPTGAHFIPRTMLEQSGNVVLAAAESRGERFSRAK